MGRGVIKSDKVKGEAESNKVDPAASSWTANTHSLRLCEIRKGNYSDFTVHTEWASIFSFEINGVAVSISGHFNLFLQKTKQEECSKLQFFPFNSMGTHFGANTGLRSLALF